MPELHSVEITEIYSQHAFLAEISWKQRVYPIRDYYRVDLTKYFFGDSKFFILPHCALSATAVWCAAYFLLKKKYIFFLQFFKIPILSSIWSSAISRYIIWLKKNILGVGQVGFWSSQVGSSIKEFHKLQAKSISSI